MKTVDLTNEIIYYTFQTKFSENAWANHVNCLGSGVIDYHSFPHGSFISLKLHLLWLPNCFIISEDYLMPLYEHFPFLGPTHFPEGIFSRYDSDCYNVISIVPNAILFALDNAQ